MSLFDSEEDEYYLAEEDTAPEYVTERYYASVRAELEELRGDGGEIAAIEKQMDFTRTEPSAPQAAEPDELEISHTQQQTAFELYQQNMHRELQDDVLPHELEELHEKSLKLALEVYNAHTRQLDEESVVISRDTLLQSVETIILELREIAQARRESLNAAMSDDMRTIYTEMVSQSRQLFLETASFIQDNEHLDQAYATAIDYATNTFDLATHDMAESNSIPRRLLLAEMSSIYKTVKRDQSWATSTAERNTTDVSNQIHAAEQDNVVTRPVYEEAESSPMEVDPSEFDDQMSQLEVTNVNNGLVTDLNEVRNKTIETHLVKERSQAFESYKLAMAHTNSTTPEALVIRHSETLAPVISTFMQRTQECPPQLVNSERLLLQQDMERALDRDLNALKNKLRNAEIEKINAAVQEARNTYSIASQCDASAWVETRSIPVELHSLRMSHRNAQQAAIQTFNQLTRDIDSLLVIDFRNELLSEFQQKLDVSLNHTDYRNGLPLPFI